VIFITLSKTRVRADAFAGYIRIGGFAWDTGVPCRDGVTVPSTRAVPGGTKGNKRLVKTPRS
jgi:hypothetical protein